MAELETVKIVDYESLFWRDLVIASSSSNFESAGKLVNRANTVKRI